MICIAAIVYDNTVYMGADSKYSVGLDITARVHQGVFLNGGFIMRFAGAFGQLKQKT